MTFTVSLIFFILPHLPVVFHLCFLHFYLSDSFTTSHFHFLNNHVPHTTAAVTSIFLNRFILPVTQFCSFLFFNTQSVVTVTNYEAEHYSRGHQLCNHLIVSQHFMEPEGSSSNSQEVSTCLYPLPDQSSPHHLILSLQES
jgi:hypothetical protein